MNWTHEVTTGRAHWAGKDSIYNLLRGTRGGFVGGAVTMFIFGAIIALPAVFGPNDSLGAVFKPFFGGLALIIGGFGVLLWVRAKDIPASEWIGQAWTLSAQPDGSLAHSGGWSLPLSQVASIEAGPTTDWQKVRAYSTRPTFHPVAIPGAEYQTFIMATDGRRLVVHTVNAGREDTAALALSLRRWLEAQRTGGAAHVTASPSPIAEPGFSL